MCFRQHFKAAFVPVNMFRRWDWVENGLETWKGCRIREIHSTFNWFIQIDPSSECLCGLYGRDWLLEQKKLKISINLSISLLIWKNQCFAERRDVVNAMNFWWKQSSLPKFHRALSILPPHFSIKKSFFNTHSDTNCTRLSVFWLKTYPWVKVIRWLSDNGNGANRKCFITVTNYFSEAKSYSGVSFWCIFPFYAMSVHSAGFWSRTRRYWERIEWLASGTEVTRDASKLELKKSKRQKVSINKLIYRKHSRSFEGWCEGRFPVDRTTQPSTRKSIFFRSRKTSLKGNKFPICCHKFMQQKHKIIDLQRCLFPSLHTAARIASKTRHFGAGAINSVLCCVARLLWSLSSLVLSVVNQQFDDISWRPRGDKRMAAIVLETAMTTSQAIFI